MSPCLCLLSLLCVLPTEADSARPVVPLPAAQLPEHAAVPESVPTAHATVPMRSAPTGSDWMLSLEGVTRAPVDVGGQITLESPFHVRAFIGYGWVPTAFSSLFTGIASSASSDSQVGVVLNHASYEGRTFRTALGIRPFTGRGLHLDVGYTRVSLDGTLASTGVPALAAQAGGYHAHTSVDAWIVEVGSQAEAWGLVFGFAFGLMRTFDSQTSIAALGGAPASTALGSAAQQTDVAVKTYGYVPTLTLRFGFDLLSLRALAWHADSPG